MIRVVLAYIPLTLWAAGVLVVGGLDLGVGSLPSGSDKVAHFLAYGVGGGLAALAGRWSRGAGWWGLVFVALVAMVDELHQGTVVYRTADVWDWVADMAGALLFYSLVRRIPRKGAGGE
ncbi:MAG TPA: VanZ family protein [Longimicrobiales bacterium]|nr:VanZ family protein [Longimicrobiales bacterium]